MSTPEVSRGEPAIIVAAAGFLFLLGQTVLRTEVGDFLESRRLFETLDWRERTITLKRHNGLQIPNSKSEIPNATAASQPLG